MASRYWVGGSGTWNGTSTSHWSATSGGIGGASVPTAADDVYFNGSSGGGFITIGTDSGAGMARNFSTVGFTGTFPGGGPGGRIDVVGNVSLGCSIDSASVLPAGGATCVITSNGFSFTTLLISVQNDSGAVSLADGLTVTNVDPSKECLTLTASTSANLTFDANGYDVTAGSIALRCLAVGSTLAVNMGDGLWLITGNDATAFSSMFGGYNRAWYTLRTGDIDIDSGGSTIRFTDTSSNVVSFAGAGGTYNDVEFARGAKTSAVYDSNQFASMTIDAGATVKFYGGTTQEIGSLLSLGTPTSRVNLKSSTTGAPWYIYNSTGSQFVQYTAIEDSVAIGGAAFLAQFSVDLGGNSGWTITGDPTAGDIASAEAFGTPFIPAPAPDPDWSAVGKEDEKEYLYKVSKPDGTYVGVWPPEQIKDELEFTQRINTPGTTTTVRLARSANNTAEERAHMLTEALDILTAEDGARLVSVTETPYTVGEDTDVELNYNVDVYVVYGEFADLITQDGDFITTEAGEQLVVATGAPLGTPVFRGFILDYESRYSADEESVIVTLASHGYELSHEVIRSGTTTTVAYSAQELATQLKSILDTNPGEMTYDAGSIANTGVSQASKFELNTKLEGIESLFDRTPDGFYWYGNVAENLVYLREVSATPDHVFIRGQHIVDLAVRRSLEGLINAIWFVGGETTPGDPATAVYKYYEDTTSQTNWRKGISRIVDRRYTVTAHMQARADKQIGRYGSPVFSTPLTITSARYDLESVQLGQAVGFAGFGNFIDSLVLQIVERAYRPTQLVLQLGELQERQVDNVSDLGDELNNEQFSGLPTTPS